MAETLKQYMLLGFQKGIDLGLTSWPADWRGTNAWLPGRRDSSCACTSNTEQSLRHTVSPGTD